MGNWNFKLIVDGAVAGIVSEVVESEELWEAKFIVLMEGKKSEIFSN